MWVYFWALCFEEYIDIDIVTDIFFWLHNTVCGTLVPWQGIKATASVVKMRSPNLWTTREFPGVNIFKKIPGGSQVPLRLRICTLDITQSRQVFRSPCLNYEILNELKRDIWGLLIHTVYILGFLPVPNLKIWQMPGWPPSMRESLEGPTGDTFMEPSCKVW